MTQGGSVHPELARAAGKAPSFTLRLPTLWLMRLAMRLMPVPRTPRDVAIENRRMPGRRRLRLYRPLGAAAPLPVLLWFHGGGYVMGRPEMDDAICARYAREAGICVVSVDYRLAPGRPFPAGLEDGYAALSWVHAQAGDLGIERRCIAIGGASAGGGLAAALAQMVQDRAEIGLALQLLVYPMLDDRTAFCGDPGAADHIAWSRPNNRFGWTAYLGQSAGAPELPRYAAPARRRDLSGLPPAWIGVGTLDLFHDEDLAYACGLQAAGVACEIVTVPGAFHGFDVFAPEAPLVEAFRQAQIAALRQHLHPAAETPVRRASGPQPPG